MKVMVTGSNGQIGISLINKLKNRSDIELFAFNKTQLNITKAEHVFSTVNGIKPDVIINAAAYTAVDKAEEESELCYKINFDGAKYLAQAAQKVDALLIHISTDYVFDGCKSAPYTEDDLPNPLSIYGKSKLAGEQEIISHCSRYTILRTAWVFSEFGTNFLNTMLKLGQKTELRIVEDQYGGPTYASDIANVLLKIMDKMIASPGLSSDIFHFSGMPYTNWFEFSKRIFAETKKSGITSSVPILCGISTQEYPTTAIRPANSRLDCKKIQSEFGIFPCDWQSSLQKCIHKLKESQK